MLGPLTEHPYLVSGFMAFRRRKEYALDVPGEMILRTVPMAVAREMAAVRGRLAVTRCSRLCGGLAGTGGSRGCRIVGGTDAGAA